MASRTKHYKARKAIKKAKSGKDRKNYTAAVGTTPTKEEFFSGKSER